MRRCARRPTTQCRSAQTQVRNEETGLQAIMEYPVTMNTNRANDIYQVDTGPVALT